MDIAQNKAQNEAQRAQRFLGGTGKQYKPSLDSLMSFIAGQPFARDYIYTDAELCAIQPKHVLRWMNFRTFGQLAPDPVRCSTGKKLSHSFIPTDLWCGVLVEVKGTQQEVSRSTIL